MAIAWRSFAFAFLCYSSWLLPLEGMEFDMMYQSKCLTEEISKGVLVSGEYEAHEKEDRTRPVHVNVKVRE